MAVGCKVVPKEKKKLSHKSPKRAEREADAGTVKEFSISGIIRTTLTRQLGEAFLGAAALHLSLRQLYICSYLWSIDPPP